MKKWTTAYRNTLLLTSMVILLPMLTSALVWQKVTWFPLELLASHWLVLFFILRDRNNAHQSARVIRFIFWLFPVTSLICGAVQALMRTGFDGYALIVTVFYLAFGLMFLTLGNLMPKVRQNSTIGIKIKWTLENEQNWNATHRFSGRLWVLGGILCMACALDPESGVALGIFTVDVLVLAFLPMLYSYRYYRRQLACGSIAPSPVSRKGAAAVAFFSVAICAFVGWSLFSGSMDVRLGAEAVSIETRYWKDLTIPYEDIDEIAFYEHDPSQNVDGARVNGFDNLRFSMGAFKNSLYGRYTRYTHASCDAVIVMNVDGETVVLNGADEAATRALYDELQARVG